MRAVTRIATPATETTWLNVALDATAAQVEQIVRTQRRITAADADHQENTRSLSWREADDDGALVITLRVPAAEGAAVIAAVQDHTTPEAGVPIAARRADAMVELLLGPEIATPTVTIVTTADTLAPGLSVDDDGEAAPGPCATDTGIAIDPGTAAAAACDGPVIVADPDGTYRRQRYPTTATRRLLALRDPTCRFPGCHHTGRREAHHLTHWIHGGSRDPDNLLLICAAHTGSSTAGTSPFGSRPPALSPPGEPRATRITPLLRHSPNRGPDPRQTRCQPGTASASTITGSPPASPSRQRPTDPGFPAGNHPPRPRPAGPDEPTHQQAPRRRHPSTG